MALARVAEQGAAVGALESDDAVELRAVTEGTKRARAHAKVLSIDVRLDKCRKYVDKNKSDWILHRRK